MPRKKNVKKSVAASATTPQAIFTVSVPKSEGGTKFVRALTRYAKDQGETRAFVVRKLLASFLKKKGYFEA